VSKIMPSIKVLTGKPGNQKETIVEATTFGELKNNFKPKVSIHRKTFKMAVAGKDKPVTINGKNDQKLSELGITEKTPLTYKDLGPQIGYRTVFVVEYAGPIAMMLLYASRPSWIYGSAAAGTALSETQMLWAGLFIAHFVKRELETFFVHKFSRPTMPLQNLFKNSMYYWMFAAIIGYFLCHPDYTPATHNNAAIAIGGWAVSELLNFAVHMQLSFMRPKEGDTTRKAPRGGLFSIASCPNYTFEVLGWVFYSYGTSILMSWGFTLVGFLQMTDWALKKHRAYCRDEPDLKKRKAIVPFLI